MKTYYVIRNDDNLIVSTFQEVDGFVAPEHKHGPEKETRVVPLVIDDTPAELDSFRQYEAQEDVVQSDRVLRRRVARAKPAPGSAPMWAVRALLDLHGLLAAIDGWVSARTGTAGVIAKQRWSTDQSLSRDSSLVAAIAAAAGFSEQETDDFFREAVELAEQGLTYTPSERSFWAKLVDLFN